MPKYATRGYLLLATLIVVGIVGLGRPGEWLPAWVAMVLLMSSACQV